MSPLVPCSKCGRRPRLIDHSDYGDETAWDFAVRCACGQRLRGQPGREWVPLLRFQAVELWNQRNTVAREEHGTV